MFKIKVVEKVKTHVLSSITFFFNCAVYEIMWKNIVEPGRPQMTYGAHTACWIPMSTNRHSEYIILIAFPLQQWLHKYASILCSTYIGCLV